MEWRALLTRWLFPNLLPLFPAVYAVVFVQGALLAAAVPQVDFWPTGLQVAIAGSVDYGIFLWVLALLPAIAFLTIAPVLARRIEYRWRPVVTVGLAVGVGASALALVVALLTRGGFVAQFVLLAPIWILYGVLVHLQPGAPARRPLRAALAGSTLGVLALRIPFLGVGALLWAGLLIGEGRREEAGWVLASAAVMPALLFATTLSIDPPPPLAGALAAFTLAILGVGIGLIVMARRGPAGGEDLAEEPLPDEVEPQPRARQGR